MAKALALCGLFLVLCACLSQYSTAATAANFASANASVASAFQSLYSAEKSGGNVTSLTVQLNQAVALIQKAQSENSTDPSLATADLQNATSIANQVASESVAVGQSGASALRMRDSESIASAIVIVVAVILVYIYGGRIFRRVWFLLYRSYLVRPTHG